MTDGTERLKKRFAELSERAAGQGCAVFSDFLTLSEQSVLKACAFGVPVTLFGGYDAAERRLACFGCEEADGPAERSPLVCVKMAPVSARFAERLSHRDFLGSLLALGLRREKLGDILIFKNAGYLFCFASVAGYITEKLVRVRRTAVRCTVTDAPPEQSASPPEEQTVLAASLRADALAAAVYRLSRSGAQSLFPEGRVFADGRQIADPSRTVGEGEIISVRGLGRFIFCGVCGETKKSRLKVRVRIF